MSTRTIVLVAGLFAAVVVSILALARQTMAPIRGEFEAANRIAMAATPKRNETPPGWVSGNALVEPADEETRVASQVAGRVAVVKVTEGQRVNKGDVLLEFDHGVEEGRFDAAVAEAEIAQAELQRVAHGMRSQDIVATIAEAEAARSRKELAEAEARRTTELAKSGALSASESDKAMRAAEATKDEFQAASARADAARHGSRTEDIMVAQARLKAARARREEAQAALSLMIVRAPVTGEILRIKIKPGEGYNPLANEPLVLMGDTSKLRVRADIDERDIGKVAVGAPAYITAMAFGDAKFNGKVTSIAPRMGRRRVRVDDPVDRVDVKILEVVLELDDTSKLIPGMRVVAFIQVKK